MSGSDARTTEDEKVCAVCHRVGQPLRLAPNGKFVCVDQAACFDQWLLNRGEVEGLESRDTD